jgi:UDP-N-acetylglucosamine--N-acetylmuramyl-(pentapeptide) pyrophosphoryl-undecaprenol N-acetylglucosamine transferase
MATDLETLWVGGEGGMEQDLVGKAGLRYRAIPAAGVHGIAMRKLPRNLIQLTRGWLASNRIIREFKPDILFFTGGYVAGPMAIAGRRIPTLVFVPDIEPGLALKMLARLADRITVTVSETQKYIKKGVIVTGYPLRPELAGWERKKARLALKLSTDKPTVLIFGGSKGAHSLNMAVLVVLPALLERTEVIHITGELDWEEIERAATSMDPSLAKRYHRFAYLHEMGQALAAADLVVSRAGASSLGELPYFGVPAILVPYPHAWRYQKVNAEYLARNGAAVVLEDSQLKEDLLPTVLELLENPGKRERMRKAMQKLAHPRAAQEIASQLVELAGEKIL